MRNLPELKLHTPDLARPSLGGLHAALGRPDAVRMPSVRMGTRTETPRIKTGLHPGKNLGKFLHEPRVKK